MSDPPFVSIIVPTRNRAALLRDCLISLLAQDYAPDQYEIVIVDDGSRDETVAVVSEFARRSIVPPVRLVAQPPRGLNAARNTGITAARGDPICFVDDDVEAPKGWLSAMVGGVGRYPEVGCLGGPVRIRLEGKVPRLCGREPNWEGELDVGPADRLGVLVCGANITVRREALHRTGPFCEELPYWYDETEWEERLLRAGGQTAYVAGAWLWHRRTADDLRLWALMKRRFRRGKGWVEYLRVNAAPLPGIGRELVAVGRVLGHAIRRRCWWGVVSAAGHLGTVAGILREGR